jgi:hypothetical protein
VITNNTRKIKNRIFAAAETHRSNIMRKLGFHSIRDLVVYAVKNNIIQVQVPTHLQSPTEGSAAWHPKAVAVNAGGGKRLRRSAAYAATKAICRSSQNPREPVKASGPGEFVHTGKLYSHFARTALVVLVINLLGGRAAV